MTDALSIAGSRTERRIGWLTVAFGATAAVAATLFGERAWAIGLAIGMILGWLNFRWLGRGLDALVLASTVQHGSEKPLVPSWNHMLVVLRYALIGLTVYAIFKYRNIPLASMILGMCALAAAAFAACVWEIISTG